MRTQNIGLRKSERVMVLDDRFILFENTRSSPGSGNDLLKSKKYCRGFFAFSGLIGI